ncbi:MAG: hypothetical protein K2H09_08445, partial [Treponemataceae bacterium]|nr:hypothetical protein [Treponemataceae bacterium]
IVEMMEREWDKASAAEDSESEEAAAAAMQAGSEAAAMEGVVAAALSDSSLLPELKAAVPSLPLRELKEYCRKYKL